MIAKPIPLALLAAHLVSAAVSHPRQQNYTVVTITDYTTVDPSSAAVTPLDVSSTGGLVVVTVTQITYVTPEAPSSTPSASVGSYMGPSYSSGAPYLNSSSVAIPMSAEPSAMASALQTSIAAVSSVSNPLSNSIAIPQISRSDLDTPTNVQSATTSISAAASTASFIASSSAEVSLQLPSAAPSSNTMAPGVPVAPSAVPSSAAESSQAAAPASQTEPNQASSVASGPVSSGAMATAITLGEPSHHPSSTAVSISKSSSALPSNTGFIGAPGANSTPVSTGAKSSMCSQSSSTHSITATASTVDSSITTPAIVVVPITPTIHQERSEPTTSPTKVSNPPQQQNSSSSIAHKAPSHTTHNATSPSPETSTHSILKPSTPLYTSPKPTSQAHTSTALTTLKTLSASPSTPFSQGAHCPYPYPGETCHGGQATDSTFVTSVTKAEGSKTEKTARASATEKCPYPGQQC